MLYMPDRRASASQRVPTEMLAARKSLSSAAPELGSQL